MFVGRLNEIKTLNEFIDGNKKSLLLYGKRRVGKTALLKKAYEWKKYVYYECIKDTLDANIKSFINCLVKQGITIPSFVTLNSFNDVFSYLDSRNEKMDIIIDEYPYLYEYEDSKKIDSSFQNVIDNSLNNIKLVLCGSNVAIMSSLLEEGNALFGRFDYVVHLKELNYKEAQNFYKNEDIYNKIAYYSIFGGSPYLNELIDNKLSLKENIMNCFLTETNLCFIYCENLLFTDVPTSINMGALCTALRNGKKTCTEIENLLHSSKNGGMNKKLDLLTKMGLITKYQPINKLGNSKSTRYEICDNAIRFFYSFIYQNKSILSMIGKERFYDEFISDRINTFISHRFEEIVRNYYSLAVRNGEYKDIINIGTYYYDDPINKTNGEFDVALKLKNGKYKIVEVKYYKDNPLSLKEMIQEFEQIKKIKEINIDSVSFVSTSGYEDDKEFETLDITKLYN